jgi:hypothetical protein
MKKNICACWLAVCSLYGPYCFTKCNKPTAYKSYYSYIIYLTKQDKQLDNFFLVLTKTPHGLFGGEPHKRTKNEPLIRFEQYKKTIDPSNPHIVCVDYGDFIKAIHSDQPSHNIRIPSGERYITLSKIMAREFRNGIAQKTLEKIVQAGTKRSTN